jgi:hypothetical protein
MDTTEQQLDPRRREVHPERITVGGEVFIRNDILAREQGESERSLNRGDKDGAPYRFFGGVKYRPQRLHAEFIMKAIQVRKPQSHNKRSHKKIRKRT